jgi:hypothetical protein
VKLEFPDRLTGEGFVELSRSASACPGDEMLGASSLESSIVCDIFRPPLFNFEVQSVRQEGLVCL